MRMKPLSRHLKSLCRQLGPEYRVTVIDLEYVINRDFGNGYDIEISGVNTSKADATATIYLWKDKKRIVKVVDGVPQQNIGKWSEWLRNKAEHFTSEDFGKDGYLKNEVRTIKAGDGFDAS